MARPSKSLGDHVRDGSFEARRARHRVLLSGDDLPWPALAALQARYRSAATDFERRSIAREFERAVVAAHEEATERAEETADEFQQELLKLGKPHTSRQVIGFFERYYVWDDGSPWRLDKWQKDFLADLYKRDRRNKRIVQEALLGICRGQGKTPLAAGLCTHAIATVDKVRTKAFQVAGSKLQASLGTGYAINFVGDGDLGEVLRTRRNSIERRDGRGTYTVVGSDGRLAHGQHGRYVAIEDELWLFKSDNEVQAYTAFESALHKDEESYLLGISTAGYDLRSLLGRKYRRGLACPVVETHRQGFLTIGRDVDAGFLMWWFGMPQGYDLDLEDDKAVMRALKLANPGTWTNHHAMLRSLRRAMSGNLEEGDEIQDELEWLRLCLNYWTSVRGAWLKPGAWRSLAENPIEIPRGADIYVAVDAAHSYDTTAVSWSWFSSAHQKVVTRCKVFSVRQAAPAHTYVDDFYDAAGDRHVAERFIHEKLAGNYRVREVVGDPNYFGQELARLGQRFKTAPVYPQSKDMRDYVQRFYRDVHAKRISTDGDLVVTAHVEAIVAEKSSDGYWVLRKRDQADPMDAGTATIISNGRAQPDRQDVSVYEHRGIAVLDGAPDPEPDDDETRTKQALTISPELAAKLGLNLAQEDDLDDDLDDDPDDFDDEVDEW